MSAEPGLVIDLRFPEQAFLYRSTKPRVLIDGVEQPVPGWGQHRFAVPPGPHQVQVYVPYVLPRRAGRAALEVTVPPEGEVVLEYLAPTFTMARGALGEPGRQVSTGASTVRVANIVVLVLIVLALGVIVALG
jgi:hypothetical protein